MELFVLVQGMPEMAFVPQQAAVEKFVEAGLHPPFHDRVHSRHPDTREHGLNASLGEDLVHERRELAVPVAEQVAGPAAGVIQIHHQVLDRLGDSIRGRVCGGAEEADASGGVVDDGQDVLTPPVEGDGLDEVTRQ
nr:hypothetical protein [Herbidospora daliensis]